MSVGSGISWKRHQREVLEDSDFEIDREESREHEEGNIIAWEPIFFRFFQNVPLNFHLPHYYSKLLP